MLDHVLVLCVFPILRKAGQTVITGTRGFCKEVIFTLSLTKFSIPGIWFWNLGPGVSTTFWVKSV